MRDHSGLGVRVDLSQLPKRIDGALDVPFIPVQHAELLKEESAVPLLTLCVAILTSLLQQRYEFLDRSGRFAFGLIQQNAVVFHFHRVWGQFGSLIKMLPSILEAPLLTIELRKAKLVFGVVGFFASQRLVFVQGLFVLSGQSPIAGKRGTQGSVARAHFPDAFVEIGGLAITAHPLVQVGQSRQVLRTRLAGVTDFLERLDGLFRLALRKIQSRQIRQAFG